jgi:glucose/arabinose dehydrogenase
MSPRLVPLAVLAAAFACAAPAARAATVPTDFVDELVVGGFDEPRSFAFLPDGRVLLTEQRTGIVRMVVNGHVAAQNPVLVVPGVNGEGYERGMQGIAIDPQWPARPYLYVFHNSNGGRNMLVRFTGSGAIHDPNAESISFGGRVVLIGDVRDEDANHNAGSLRFAPDGKLMLGLGEDEVECDAQDSTSLRGCVLRLDVSGIPAVPAGPVTRAQLRPASGNPLSTPDSNAALVWAYGLRNPWSLEVDAYTGEVYAADVGEADYEEINHLSPGGNYGWPYREGPMTLGRPLCPEPGFPGDPANGYRPPIAFFSRDAALHAAVAGVVYRPPVTATAIWPADHRGSLFWGDYYDGWLRRLVRDEDGTWGPAPAVPGQPNATDWGTGFSNMVEFRIAPNGDVWWLRQWNDAFDPFSGELRRIRWTGSTAGAPPAPRGGVTLSASPNPFRGLSNVSFTLPGAAARARVAVYDLAGRRVRTLLDGAAPGGQRNLVWDGADDGGASAAPGLYLARLEVDGREAATARLLRVR